LQLDKPTLEVKSGSTVTSTVTLKDSRDQAVPAPKIAVVGGIALLVVGNNPK
jgi:hypothetical protein